MDICVEIIKKPRSTICNEKLIEECEEYLRTKDIDRHVVLTNFDASIAEHVNCIIIDENEQEDKLDLKHSNIKWHVYCLDQLGGQQEFLQNDNDNDMVSLSTNWILPASDFHGLWENLIFDTKIKDDLLQYVATMMLFSEKGVDSNIVCSNRVVLLHGPPGTGKTSLCKALSHKLAIRLQHQYKHGFLIEINSHSLFSKWFSESGKLVSKMFSKIYEMIEDTNALVCVLIDEVESLAHARNQCLSGNEPSDSIRVVNAVLTHIDQIRRFPNVLILTTSNMTAAIDLAFVDRADIKQYIGLPSIYATYQIYYSCLQELMRTGVIVPATVLQPVRAMKSNDLEQSSCSHSIVLRKICELSAGLSGRTLRKVPFIAHALFIKTESVDMDTFLNAMSSAVKYFMKERTMFELKNN